MEEKETHIGNTANQAVVQQQKQGNRKLICEPTEGEKHSEDTQEKKAATVVASLFSIPFGGSQGASGQKVRRVPSRSGKEYRSETYEQAKIPAADLS